MKHKKPAGRSVLRPKPRLGDSASATALAPEPTAGPMHPSQPQGLEKLLKVEEVIDSLRFGRRKVINHIKGTTPPKLFAYPAGRTWRIPPSAVLEFLAKLEACRNGGSA